MAAAAAISIFPAIAAPASAATLAPIVIEAANCGTIRTLEEHHSGPAVLTTDRGGRKYVCGSGPPNPFPLDLAALSADDLLSLKTFFGLAQPPVITAERPGGPQHIPPERSIGGGSPRSGVGVAFPPPSIWGSCCDAPWTPPEPPPDAPPPVPLPSALGLLLASLAALCAAAARSAARNRNGAGDRAKRDPNFSLASGAAP